ncbi:MAG: DMT family transporter [Deltaproteobacteria bacterium]|nr:DMT family transporter [Deltaproteobacteria bacterium]
MSPAVLFVMVFFGGMAVAIQPSINARLAEKVGLIESSCISFAVGALSLLLVVLFSGRGTIRGVFQASWWEFSGGLLGALFVTIAIFVVPRIGTAALMAVTIAAQLFTGLILDHFGLFGFKASPLDLKRILGVAFLLLGAGLVFKR